jgi:ribosomal protein S18 acetylase RimI-like enzyme
MTATLTRSEVDGDRAIGSIVAAFTADPFIRWLLPDAAGYLAHFPALVQVLAGQALDAGTADVASGYLGAALWLAPDVEADEAAAAELLGAAVAPDRLGEVADLLEQIGAHHPDEPCWYLPFIGVDPAGQGRGIGSGLLRQGLARCDEDHLPAYLEASAPRNRALYERHGFAVVGEIRTAGSPPLWPMWRPARRPGVRP